MRYIGYIKVVSIITIACIFGGCATSPSSSHSSQEVISSFADEINGASDSKRFQIVYTQKGVAMGDDYAVLMDTETGIQYLEVSGINGRLCVTPLLSEDGTVHSTNSTDE